MKPSCLAIVLVFAALASGQSRAPESASQQLVARLPKEWQAAVARLKMTPDQKKFYSALSDADLQPSLLRAMTRSPDTADFVLDHLGRLASAKDQVNVIRSMALFEHWSSQSRVFGVLQSFAESGRDLEVALASLHTLSLLETHRERLLVEQQVANSEGEARAKLASQDEYLMDTEKGAVVPAYLRRTPPTFAATAGKTTIRVLAFGDFGTGGSDQKQVASAMVQYHRLHPFDFGITMGDNFTPVGMASPDDPRWQSRWEELYGPMKIKFYPTFGNHDWSSPESPAAELSYKSAAGNWMMPSPYYTYTAGPAQFFAVDTGMTGAMSLAQLQWLKAELEKSQARWKIVYGHHPPYFARPDGSDTDEMVTRGLFSVLRGRADVYIAGHFHSLQHLKPVDGVNLYISAGGGRPLYPLDESSPRALFAKSVFGFSVLDIDERTFTLRFIGEDGVVLDESSVRK
jgi:hypothetical protein